MDHIEKEELSIKNLHGHGNQCGSPSNKNDTTSFNYGI
jgi:hypothetical protein